MSTLTRSFTVTSFALLVLGFACVVERAHAVPPPGATTQEPPLRIMVWPLTPEADETLDRAAREFTQSTGIVVQVIRVAPRRTGDPLEAEKRDALERLAEQTDPRRRAGERIPSGPPAEYRSQLDSRLASREPPDVIWLNRDMVIQLVRTGRIVPLDRFLEQPRARDQLSANVLESFRFEGRLYGIALGREGALAEYGCAVVNSSRTAQAFEWITFLIPRLGRAPASGEESTTPQGEGARSEGALLLSLQTTLTPAARDLLRDPSVLQNLNQLLSFQSARISITDQETRVESFTRTGEGVYTISLRNNFAPSDRPARVGDGRRTGILLDHSRKTSRPLHVPQPRTAVPAWILAGSEPSERALCLANGCVLRAEGGGTLKLRPQEARALWGEVLWIQEPGDRAAPFWAELAQWGVPDRIRLVSAASEVELVRLDITEARRGAPLRPLDLGAYPRDEAASRPLEGIVTTSPDVGGGTGPGSSILYSGSVAAGEHIGWLISPKLTSELQQLLNTVAGSISKFDQIDSSDGSLIIDWYKKAEQALGTGSKNAFTVTREFLKTLIAMHVIPNELEQGQIPSELKTPFGQWLQSIINDKKVSASQRWSTFLQALKKESGEFGGKAPTPQEHEQYRNQVLLELVDKVLMNRYAVFKVPKPKPYTYSCWAFEFTAYNFKMKLVPAFQAFKSFKVTQTGMRLDLAIDRVEVELEYEVEPSGSTENVALCIFTFGAANLVEIDYGDGDVTVKQIVLSLDITPKVVGNHIEFEVALGDASHATAEYALYGSNIFTFGKMEIISTIMTFANAFEDDLLDAVGDELDGVVNDVLPAFPAVFHFDDTPSTVMKSGVVAGNPDKALLVGATVDLPADRVPVPPPALATPSCAGDFAITLATDYLNGVLAWRLGQFAKKAGKPSIDWAKEGGVEGLPEVQLPSGYQPPGASSKFPKDFQDIDEVWEVTNPRLELAKLATPPGTDDAVGTIRMTVSYRLSKTEYAWRGSVRLPDYEVKPWWMDRWGPSPWSWKGGWYIDLDQYLTLRYGVYRQADGLVVSKAVPFLGLEPPKINPSQGEHTVDVGGILVTWSPFPVATDEHVNVDVEFTADAHITLTQGLTFLPELDLSYANAKAKTTRLNLSAHMSGLKGKEAFFEKLCGDFYKGLFDNHTFSKKFDYPYANIYLIGGKSYSPYLPGEKAVLIVYDIVDMTTPSDSKKLWIERDGEKLRVNFAFLTGIL
ncbi:MAG: hypothetical protein AB1486_21435 [Planctomycetota bacterium]